MTPVQAKTALQQALLLSREMLLAAQKDSWEAVAKLEQQRQQSLLQGMDELPAQNENSDLGLKIREIIEVDRQIQALVKQARDEVRDELVSLNKGRGAAKAYRSPPR